MTSRLVLLAVWLCAAGCDRPERASEAPAPEALMSLPDEGAAPHPTGPGPMPPAAKAPAAPVARPPVPGLSDPPPGQRVDVTAQVGGALRAALGDLDGDGKAEIVLVDAQRLWVTDRAGRTLAEVRISEGIRALEVIEGRSVGTPSGGVRHPGARGAIVAGWGETSQHRETPARITVHRLSGGRLVEEVVARPTTSRNDIASIVSAGPRLLLAYFESKYMVRASLAQKGPSGWGLEDLAAYRMATAWGHGDVDGDGEADVIVGRLYGDQTGVDGDAFLLRPGGDRIPIPTTRGVRGLAVVDTDRDGRAEVWMGDGWHQSYGTQARARLSRAVWDGHGFRAELVEELAGQFSVLRILPADVDGDGTMEIVTQGSGYIRVFRRQGSAWTGLTVSAAGRDVQVADLDEVAGDELLVVGDRSERIRLRGARWPTP